MQITKNDDAKTTMVMTVSQLAAHLAQCLNYRQIWETKFPNCDFCMIDIESCDFSAIDIEKQGEYSEEILAQLYQNSLGFCGIHRIDTGFSSTSLFLAADYYGGGCDDFCALYDGIDIEEAKDKLERAITTTLECLESVDDDTLLLVEFKGEPEMRPVWMRLGVSLKSTAMEASVLLGEDQKAAEAMLRKLVKENRFRLNGESYVPADCISEFNKKYGTKYDDGGDYEFDI